LFRLAFVHDELSQSTLAAATEVVPETEWWAMLPPDMSVHAARVTARAPWARWRDDRGGVELEEDLLRGRRQFAPI